MNVERVPVRLIRWLWEVQHDDGSISAGWTATRWGARREVAKAEAREWGRTGAHRDPAVMWRPGAEREETPTP